MSELEKHILRPPPDETQDESLPEISPDAVEQKSDGNLDAPMPTRGDGMLRVVGLGGSAGGRQALQAFFAAMPPESGMAFVVILHLSPDHDENVLAELLQRTTPMSVRQVQGRVKVEPNCVYVIPPAKSLSIEEGHLNLSDPACRPGKHVAVDLFFRTLADAHGPHAAAIVLSGADGDGANGIKRIKERGGLTVAQDPTEAAHEGMPRSAIATEMVDWVLPAAEMPARLIEYWRAEQRLRLPAEGGPPPASEEAPSAASEGDTPGETALHDILSFLRARTGRDFSCYKRATILRRIARRMQVNGLEEPPQYLAFLRTHPGEAGALLQDLLISVTNFFRDRELFAALESMIPSLFHGKGPKDAVRVWVAACATGEEAYSVAMLLLERAGTLDYPPTIQVFATDLDEGTLQYAREGAYPETIAADVSEERLRRFFTKGHGHYKVRRELRETVLFAVHDLLKDSPFSRLDLITCRNLLIYLNREAQTRALEIFHFALRPEGVLFLGSAESVDEGDPLFTAIDKKHRLYVRLASGRPKLPIVFSGPSARRQAPHKGRTESLVLPLENSIFTPPVKLALPLSAIPTTGGQASWGEVHSQAIEQFGPSSVIVNQEYDLVHLSGRAGRFLRFGAGELTTGLLRLVHPMLRLELRAVLFRAAQSGAVEEAHGVPVEIEGKRRWVDIRVAPILEKAPGCLLVIFTERESAIEAATSHPPEAESAVQQLERELDQVKTQLRDTVEQSDIAQEELKAANEELQAMNEELCSATEELESGREELQSINEELSTVNQELKSRVEEVGRANSDLQNLMASTAIATVFLDRKLCIQRYTPSAVALFNLIPGDTGRPLSDLTHRLDYPDLTADAERALDQLCAVELEVAHQDGRHFLARMLPYRTAEDYIAGVVLTFVDITLRRQAEEKLRESEARFRAVADLVPDLLYSTDSAGQLDWCNRRWLDYTGQTLTQAQGNGWRETIHPEDRERAWQTFLTSIEQGQSLRCEHRLLDAHGTARWFLSRAEPFRDEVGRTVRWFGAKTEIEDFKQAATELAASQERLRLVIENAREYAIFSLDLDRRVTSWNSGAQGILGYTQEDILGQSGDNLFTPEDRAGGQPQKEASTALAEGRAADERWHVRKDGSRFWGSGVMMRMDGPGGQLLGFVKIFRDQTAELRAKEALEQSREELAAALRETERARADAEAAGRAKDHFLAVLSHELRTPLTPVMMAVHILSRNRELTGTAREALEMIERNVQIEAHFIDDLLDITRITHGKLEIVREPTDLHQVVQHAVEISRADIEGKGQQLTVSLDAAEHALQGDATRLQQVFWNLLKNASKFTPEGGAIRIASRNEPGRAVVEISDSGIGFEAEAVTRIFEAFAQASQEVTQRFGGLGLGLAISKATVDAHGGILRAHSEGRGQGATFTVELPLSD